MPAEHFDIEHFDVGAVLRKWGFREGMQGVNIGWWGRLDGARRFVPRASRYTFANQLLMRN